MTHHIPDHVPYFGRGFTLKDGTIVLPCEFCGCPVFPETYDSHMCIGLYEAIEAEFTQRLLDI